MVGRHDEIRLPRERLQEDGVPGEDAEDLHVRVRSEPRERRREHLDLLVAEESALARVRVEPREGDSGPFDPPPDAQRFDRDPGSAREELHIEHGGHVAQREMRGEERQAQRSAEGRALGGHHHRDIVRPGQFLEELRVTRVRVSGSP